MARRHAIRTPTIRTAALALSLLTMPLVAGCDDQQSAEKTGQEIGRTVDQTADRAGEAAKDATAKAGQMLQNAGEAIQQKARDAKQDIKEAEKP
ncbi:hypothetical protein [Azospirillum rugosum]|uniref:Uncharacterized protein n=1 Tax=Azospirillum rugosum TaxID=416170 RepID=A0ABS4SPK9_9PROT|nr:hypothetical protein [Azospirillum rugosum]MBP2294184.1 hypothetical protein [Azospirillum rugosum]MDQ0527427.1 hypothetical protein [Azospirillum rugosum]